MLSSPEDRTTALIEKIKPIEITNRPYRGETLKWLRIRGSGLRGDRRRSSPPLRSQISDTPSSRANPLHSGLGVAIQAMGVILCFLMFPVGLLAGIALLVAGGRVARA